MSSDCVVIVTGGGSGIGRCTAVTLAQHGYRVVLAGRREQPLQETAAEMPAEQTLVVPTDVTCEASVGTLFERTVDAWQRVDVLFNNAGIAAPAVPLEDLSLEHWQQLVDVNLTGSFLCTREAIRVMKRQRPQGGRIINNGSVSAHTPRPLSAPYTATKHAVTGLTKSTALDGRSCQIACGQIDIGNAATQMSESMETGVLQADGSVRSEPRMDVQHVADAVLYMAGLPLDANVPFMTVMATGMPLLGRG